jgi:hypothetical protein
LEFSRSGVDLRAALRAGPGGEAEEPLEIAAATM